MLYKVYFQDEKDKIQAYHTEFDQDCDLWLVGDLRTKLYLQAQSISKKGYFFQESHLRARDFWNSLFKSVNLDLVIVEPHFLEAWLQDHLIDSEPAGSLLLQQSPSFFVQMMRYLGPLILSQEGESHMQQYFTQNLEAASRWQHWYHLAFKLSQLMLFEKKWILADWLPHILLTHLEEHAINIRKRKLFVDLGPDLKLVEAQLFKLLSSYQDVYIYEPDYLNSKASNRYLLQAYRHLDVAKTLPGLLSEKDKAEPTVTCELYATESGQIKAMFQTTLSLASKGISSEQVVWLFPKVEKVLPLLQHLSNEYKLELNMSPKIKATSDALVIQWMQRLRVIGGSFRLGAIEVVKEFSNLSLTQKRSWLRRASVIDELPDFVRGCLNQMRAPERLLSFQQFTKLIFNEWPDSHENQLLIKILNHFSSQVESEAQLKYSSWLNVLEAILPRIESSTDVPALNGVKVLSISEWSLIPARVVMVSSLVQDYFKKSESVYIQTHDIESLNRDFGYQLDHPVFNTQELDLEWLLQSSIEHIYLFGFHLDLKANTHALHPLLLRKLMNNQVKSPALDCCQKQLMLEIENSQVLAKKTNLRMGVTRFETFAKCPMKFFLESDVKLDSVNEFDFDLDLKSEGNLHHKIMELMLKNWGSDLKSESAKKRILEQAIEQSQTHLRESLDKIVWQDLEHFYDQFLSAEMEFKKQYPKAQVVGLEVPIEAYLDLQLGQVVACAPDHQNSLCLKGFVDRIDKVGEFFIIIDYKRSSKNDYGLSSWVKSCFYQLYYYGKALSLNPPSSLKGLAWGGAEILNYTRFERDGGFLVNEVIPDYRDRPKPLRAPIGYNDLDVRLYPVQSAMFKVAEQLMQQRVTASVPEAVRSICDYCSWRLVCRAPHLM